MACPGTFPLGALVGENYPLHSVDFLVNLPFEEFAVSPVPFDAALLLDLGIALVQKKIIDGQNHDRAVVVADSKAVGAVAHPAGAGICHHRPSAMPDHRPTG